ncbi:MAG: outer membrane lipoprotein-sorting protein [Bacteroidetes bacterium]|nr:outer membrane lipoprotein-sorting protein [Bacteroidota bacterium]
MKRLFVLLTLVSIVLVTPAAAQKLTAERILQNVKANFDAVKDYTAQLTGTVSMERLKVPKMSVKIYFKQPNKFKTESKGTSFLPKNILDINPADLLERFDASLLGKEELDGKTYYKIRLITKAVKGKQVRESFIWVLDGEWTITRLESYPSEGRKIEVLVESVRIDGKYILPAKITARFDFEQNPDSLAERIYSPQRVPRKGSAELIYSDYQVNTGLSDELFEDPKKQE